MPAIQFDKEIVMRKLFPALVLSAALAPAVHAANLELTLNDEMAQFLVTSSAEPWGMRDAETGIGILFNENDDLLGTLRLLSTNRVSPSLRLGVGLQGYLGELDKVDETASAVAIGGNIGFGLAAQVPLTLVLEGWIAPGILAFGDIDGVTELAARVEAAVSPRATVFAGYRTLEMDIDGGGDYELDDGVNIGVRIGF
jgi:hypothetical protein